MPITQELLLELDINPLGEWYLSDIVDICFSPNRDKSRFQFSLEGKFGSDSAFRIYNGLDWVRLGVFSSENPELILTQLRLAL